MELLKTATPYQRNDSSVWSPLAEIIDQWSHKTDITKSIDHCVYFNIIDIMVPDIKTFIARHPTCWCSDQWRIRPSGSSSFCSVVVLPPCVPSLVSQGHLDKTKLIALLLDFDTTRKSSLQAAFKSCTTKTKKNRKNKRREKKWWKWSPLLKQCLANMDSDVVRMWPDCCIALSTSKKSPAATTSLNCK